MKSFTCIPLVALCLLGGFAVQKAEAMTAPSSSLFDKMKSGIVRVVDGKNSTFKIDLAWDEEIFGRTWQHRTATLLPLITLVLLLDKKMRGDKSLLSGGGRVWDNMIGKLPEKVRAVGRSIAKYLPESTGTKAFVGSMGALGLLLTILGLTRTNHNEHMGGYAFGQAVPNVLMSLYNPALSTGAVASVLLAKMLKD